MVSALSIPHFDPVSSMPLSSVEAQRGFSYKENPSAGIKVKVDHLAFAPALTLPSELQ